MVWHWPRIRTRPALGLLCLFGGVGLAQGILIRLLRATHGGDSHEPVILFQLVGAVGAWAAVPIVQFVVLNVASPSSHTTASTGGRRGGAAFWIRFFAAHATGYLCFAIMHVALIRAVRALLYRLSLVHVGDGELLSRVLWEMQNDLVVYGGAAALLTMVKAWKERDDSALRSAELEASLAEAKLEALSAQVDPHFFYNALNTISAVMYEDLPRCERLLGNLATLMRATLGRGGRTWSLDEERAHTERYVELLLARFGERLRVSWHESTPPPGATVPRFAVQTLVENAVKHNARRREPLTVTVRIQSHDDVVEVVVADDGVGFDSAPSTPGRGLARLEETLKLLHGARASFEHGNNDDGGARVRLVMPCSPS
jgi:two-component system LytT family sensor kinase